jgi:hypothetical protein
MRKPADFRTFFLADLEFLTDSPLEDDARSYSLSPLRGSRHILHGH